VAGRHLVSPDGAEGVAVGNLDPEGIVRVNGENWSAVAVNGPVRAGTPVQVVRVSGVRLEIWGDEMPVLGGDNELEATIPPTASQSRVHRPRLPRRPTKEVAHDHRDRDRGGGALPPHPRRNIGEDRARVPADRAVQTGRALGTRGPGLILINPVTDRTTWVDLREQYLEIPHQTAITKDNASISIDFIIFYKVIDPSMSVLRVGNFAGAAQNVAATTLRSVVGDMPLDDVLSKREDMNASLRVRLDEVTERWGVKVTTVEVREVNRHREYWTP